MERRRKGRTRTTGAVALTGVIALTLLLGTVLATGCGKTGGDDGTKPTPSPSATGPAIPTLVVGADSQEVLDWLDDAGSVLAEAPAVDAIDLDLAQVEADPGSDSDPAPLLTAAAGMEKDLDVPVPTVDTIR